MEVLLDSTNFIEERGKKSISIWGWKDAVREESFFNYKTALLPIQFTLMHIQCHSDYFFKED